jgi:DNA-directed RNA polymerase subunit RPC12/RpoP
MLTTIATFSFPYEAHIARAKLESEGIPAFVADEQTINMQWLYSNALGGVRLQVPGSYAERALEVLEEDRSEVLEQQEGYEGTSCELCGSKNTEPHQKGKRWAFLVFLGLDFPLFPVKNAIRCKDCGHISERA